MQETKKLLHHKGPQKMDYMPVGEVSKEKDISYHVYSVRSGKAMFHGRHLSPKEAFKSIETLAAISSLSGITYKVTKMIIDREEVEIKPI